MKNWIAKSVKALSALAVFASSTIAAAPVFAEQNTLRVQTEVEVASLDPQIATDGTSVEVLATFLEGLTQSNDKGEVVPAIAESYTLSEDQKVYTFKIRENANWSNGDPVTAHDFIYAWQRLVNPETGSEYSFIAGTGNIVNAADIVAGKKKPEELGVKAVDDKTLEVTLTQPTPYFLDLVSFVSFLPVNQKFYEGTKGKYATSAENVLSNGAFIVENYEPSATQVKVKRNPDYYDKDKITLENIEFQTIKDAQQSTLSFQTGQLDLAKIEGEQVTLYENDPNLKKVDLGYMWFLSPNNDNADLKNVNLRRAIGHAIDRDTITNNILKDGSRATDTFIPRHLAQNSQGQDYREFAGEGMQKFDKEMALKFYDEAKKELGKDKFSFKLLVEDTEASINVAQSIEAQVEQVLPGLDIQIEQTPKKNRLDRMNKGEFDIGLTRWGPDYADPTTYLQLLVSGTSYNHSRYSNAEFDKAFEEVMHGEIVTDEAARWNKMKEMEVLALDEVGVIPLYQASYAQLTQPGVEGVIYRTVGTPRIFKYATKQAQ